MCAMLEMMNNELDSQANDHPTKHINKLITCALTPSPILDALQNWKSKVSLGNVHISTTLKCFGNSGNGKTKNLAISQNATFQSRIQTRKRFVNVLMRCFWSSSCNTTIFSYQPTDSCVITSQL